MIVQKKFLSALVALAAAIVALPSAGALAATALAVGVTGKPSEGIAFGFSYNYDTEDEAKRTALESCFNYKPAPKAAKRCKLIGSVKKGCLGVAFDPKDDSPGMGWVVAEKRADAESGAIAACQAAAPRSRRQYCKIDTVKCDGDEPPKKQ